MHPHLVAALESVLDAVEAPGGVLLDGQGYACPVADPDWTDLGEA